MPFLISYINIKYIQDRENFLYNSKSISEYEKKLTLTRYTE